MATSVQGFHRPFSPHVRERVRQATIQRTPTRQRVRHRQGTPHQILMRPVKSKFTLLINAHRMTRIASTTVLTTVSTWLVQDIQVTLRSQRTQASRNNARQTNKIIRAHHTTRVRRARLLSTHTTLLTSRLATTRRVSARLRLRFYNRCQHTRRRARRRRGPGSFRYPGPYGK